MVLVINTHTAKKAGNINNNSNMNQISRNQLNDNNDENGCNNDEYLKSLRRNDLCKIPESTAIQKMQTLMKHKRSTDDHIGTQLLSLSSITDKVWCCTCAYIRCIRIERMHMVGTVLVDFLSWVVG